MDKRLMEAREKWEVVWAECRKAEEAMREAQVLRGKWIDVASDLLREFGDDIFLPEVSQKEQETMTRRSYSADDLPDGEQYFSI